MKSRALIIFGLSYTIMLLMLTAADVMLYRLANWDPSGEGIGNLLGILVFTLAVLLSMMRQVHMLLGHTSDLSDFRRMLSDSRWGLTIGIVLVTTVVNLGISLVPAWYATGEIGAPSPLRTAMLSVVYAILARVIIVESAERMRYA